MRVLSFEGKLAVILGVTVLLAVAVALALGAWFAGHPIIAGMAALLVLLPL